MKSRKLKCNWSFDAKGDVISDALIEKVLVNAGNLEEVIDLGFIWYPDIEEQIERLSQEWSDPNSDGTGFLTYNRITEIMTREMVREIDREILEDMKALAGEE